MSKKEGIILIGFGGQSLAELLEEVKLDPEKAHNLAYMSIKEIPHYRSFTATTIEQQQSFVEYLDLMKAYVGEEIDEESD